MMNDQVMWLAPRALNELRGSAPSVLAFRTDDFMVDLETALTSDVGLAGIEARTETWRDDYSGFPAPTEPAPVSPAPPIKLYQPVHGRYYLVAAHLVCRRYGHPDRKLSSTESTGFVVRRMDGNAEYAWIIVDGTGRWIEQVDPGRFSAGEELLPMAPTAHEHRARRTRLLTGLVPVGAREKYEARSLSSADVSTNPDEPTAVQMALSETVIGPLQQIASPKPPLLVTDPIQEQELEALELALLDLIDWALATGVSIDADYLDETAFDTVPWLVLLLDIVFNRASVLNGTYESLARSVVSRSAIQAFLDPATAVPLEESLGDGLADLGVTEIDNGAELIDSLETEGPGEYVFRTVYQRTDCVHERAAWVSPPTERFRFASFFDPDAPARPVQISLPFDTSAKGLRQFPRNVKVLISDGLRKQMTQIDEEFKKTAGLSFDIGMLCSLSIPIITICALILLLIMVSILNIIFWWLPFFKICIPKVTVSQE